MGKGEADVARLRTVPFRGRLNKVDPSLMAKAPDADQSFHAFLESRSFGIQLSRAPGLTTGILLVTPVESLPKTVGLGGASFCMRATFHALA